LILSPDSDSLNPDLSNRLFACSKLSSLIAVGSASPKKSGKIGEFISVIPLLVIFSIDCVIAFLSVARFNDCLKLSSERILCFCKLRNTAKYLGRVNEYIENFSVFDQF